MDISRKIYKEDVIILNEIQTHLLRRDVRSSQKDLIDKAVRFAAYNKEKFLAFVLGKRRDNSQEKTSQFINSTKKHRVNFGKDWLEEIDTTL